MIRLARLLLLVITLGLFAPAAALACPNCKEAVSLGSGEAANAASGYNWSVLFMIAVPFSMVGTGALAIRRAARRGSLPEL